MSFKQIIGQEIALRILQNSLKEKRRGLTYLFYGPGGTGKSFAARQFSKALNCDQAQNEDSCDICSSCVRIEKLEYPDLHWLDLEEGSSNIKIDQIRSLQNEISLKPFEARTKVFVINNCQNLTAEAANCLLKTTEEPPADSIIILITTDLRLVLSTISSRALKLRFSQLNRNQTARILEKDTALNSEQISFFSHYLEGRIAMYPQLNKHEFIQQRENLFNGLFNHSPLTKLEDIFKDKNQTLDNLHILTSCFRDILFIKSGSRTEYLINQDKIARINKEADKYTLAQVLSILENLSKSFEYLKRNLTLKLLTDNIWLNFPAA
ncbi:MAG: DNA polymerase III subunit delta' C-terminal domain-containing protein [Candidatus Omnitrophota bacterium]